MIDVAIGLVFFYSILALDCADITTDCLTDVAVIAELIANTIMEAVYGRNSYSRS